MTRVDTELEELQAKVGPAYRVTREWGYETKWHGGRLGEKPRRRVVYRKRDKAAAERALRGNTMTPYLTKTVRGVDHDVISRLVVKPVEEWH